MERQGAQGHAARRSDPHPSSALKQLARAIRGRMLGSTAETKLLIRKER